MKYAVVFVDPAKKENLLGRVDGAINPAKWEDSKHISKTLDISISDIDTVTLEDKQNLMSLRLKEYKGSLKDWVEAEIQLLLSRTNRPKYWNKTRALTNTT